MKSFRKQRVARVVRDIVSQAIVHRLSDPRIEPLTTVTRVEMTGDLEIARVFLSVPGGDGVERRTLVALRHASGYLQRLVGQELSLRQCPEVRFEVDESLKIARVTMERLAENRRLHPELFPPQEAETQEDAEPEEVRGDGTGEGSSDRSN